jgi:hypothetical protein
MGRFLRELEQQSGLDKTPHLAAMTTTAFSRLLGITTHLSVLQAPQFETGIYMDITYSSLPHNLLLVKPNLWAIEASKFLIRR